MNAGMRQRVFGAGLVLGALALGVRAAPVAAQQSGIQGTVTDQATGQALEAARVMLTGTNRIETTNRDGKYHFREIAEGSYQVRVLRLGFKPVTDSAHVAPGETVTLDFAMEPAPVQLDEIVSTVTGEQRKLELGNAVSTIDAAKITEEAPITEFGNLLSGRAAGVTVQKTGGTTGSGTRIRIRGSNSVSLSNEPLYYIDGIRMESGADLEQPRHRRLRAGPRRGPLADQRHQPRGHRVDRDREGPGRRHAVRHPGLQRGGPDHHQARPGRPAAVEPLQRGGRGARRQHLPAQLHRPRQHRRRPVADWDGFCIVQFELDGPCTQTSVSKFSPLNDPSTTPAQDRPAPAVRRQRVRRQRPAHLLPLRRTTRTRTASSACRSSRRTRSCRWTAPSRTISSGPTRWTRLNLRANLGANVSANADLQASIGYISSDTRFVENDNSFYTITGSGEASGNPRGRQPRLVLHPRRSCSTSWPPRAPSASSAAFTGNWRPNSWLSTRATLGYDVTNRQDVQFFPTGKSADYLEQRLGISTTTASRPPRPRWTWPPPRASSSRPTSAPRPRSAASSFATSDHRHPRGRAFILRRAARPSAAPAAPRRATRP